jgi:hypothetical protein
MAIDLSVGQDALLSPLIAQDVGNALELVLLSKKVVRARVHARTPVLRVGMVGQHDEHRARRVRGRRAARPRRCRR